MSRRRNDTHLTHPPGADWSEDFVAGRKSFAWLQGHLDDKAKSSRSPRVDPELTRSLKLSQPRAPRILRLNNQAVQQECPKFMRVSWDLTPTEAAFMRSNPIERAGNPGMSQRPQVSKV